MKTNESFILRNIYGKNILMPIHVNETSADPILLNEVATVVWNEALNNQEAEEIIAKIVQEYDLRENSAEVIAIEHFIEQMIAMGLLKVS